MSYGVRNSYKNKILNPTYKISKVNEVSLNTKVRSFSIVFIGMLLNVYLFTLWFEFLPFTDNSLLQVSKLCVGPQEVYITKAPCRLTAKSTKVRYDIFSLMSILTQYFIIKLSVCRHDLFVDMTYLSE